MSWLNIVTERPLRIVCFPWTVPLESILKSKATLYNGPSQYGVWDQGLRTIVKSITLDFRFLESSQSIGSK